MIMELLKASPSAFDTGPRSHGKRETIVRLLLVGPRTKQKKGRNSTVAVDDAAEIQKSRVTKRYKST